jgi:hypothetical protein
MVFSGTTAAAAVIARAIQASGAITIVEPEEFKNILAKTTKPLIITAKGGYFRKNTYLYLMAYKGLIFFTKSTAEITLPGDAEIIAAKTIWVPGQY